MIRRLNCDCSIPIRASLLESFRLCTVGGTKPADVKDPDSGDQQQEVTPWSVTAKGPKGIDYDRVLNVFKSESVDASLLQRFSDVVQILRDRNSVNSTAPSQAEGLHPFLRRGFAFSHRDLGSILDDAAAGKRFYLYTGRGPSADSMHIGHMIPFLLTKYLQDVFQCPLVIQITDDEKFLFRDLPAGPALDKMVMNNIKDIIAFGFDPKRTFIFRNTQYMGEMYPTVLEVQRCITLSAAKNTFGFEDSDNIGKVAFPAIQAAPSFCSSFRRVLPVKGNNLRCLIPCAIDQDPFFVLTRSISDRLKRPKPSLLHTKFLPALKGPTHKMSSSAEQNGVILLTDPQEIVLKKMKKAFSGGSGTLEELKVKGPDLDVDVAYQFLRIFAKDDAVVEAVTKDYQRGAMHSGMVKELAAKVLDEEILSGWRQRRKSVTDQDVEQFCAVRDILFS
jgi:tryptophanyl-tRNA synthetase